MSKPLESQTKTKVFSTISNDFIVGRRQQQEKKRASTRFLFFFLLHIRLFELVIWKTTCIQRQASEDAFSGGDRRHITERRKKTNINKEEAMEKYLSSQYRKNADFFLAIKLDRVGGLTRENISQPIFPHSWERRLFVRHRDVSRRQTREWIDVSQAPRRSEDRQPYFIEI